MNTNIYQQAVQGIPLDIQKETALTFSVSNRIYDLLQQRGMTQKEFAKLMKKSEAEVSVWLSGQHNFTLRTIAKISAALNTDILSVQ